MKKQLVVLASLPLLLSACVVVDPYYGETGAPRWNSGDGVAMTETRYLSSFSRIEAETPVKVTVRTGNTYMAYVTTDANLTGYIRTSTFGGTLTVDLATEIEPTVSPEVVVVVPELRTIVHNGSGFVDVQEGGDFPDLELQLNGTGTMRFSGTAARLRAALNGYGRMTLEGYTAFLEADLRGAGDISAENLLAGDADVVLSGAGNIYLDLDYQSTLDLELSGEGKVEWWGAPSHLNYLLTGSGQVVEHRGLPKKAAGATLAKKGIGGQYVADLAAGKYDTKVVKSPAK